MASGKVLIVYSHDLGFPLRKTIEDHLFSFKKYSGKLCYFVNAAFGIPDYILRIKFDLIVYHTIFIGKKSLPRRFKKLVRKIEKLKQIEGYKIVLPQDEYEYTNLLNHFINEFNIDHIFSVAPKSEFELIYDKVNKEKVKIDRVLTGYLDKDTVEYIVEYIERNHDREIDIGYRANQLSFSLGKQGRLKKEIAEIFKDKCKNTRLKVDLSNKAGDTFLGLDWYKFLSNCKYTIGVEGGASILDKDGEISNRVIKYLDKFPDASFEVVSENILSKVEGSIQYFAISPRNLECCITKTCQILIEGDYNGIIKPGVDYIELKRDFSNVDEVIEMVKCDNKRLSIVEKAFRNVVYNDELYYDSFVSKLLNLSLGVEHNWSIPTSTDKSVFERLNKRELYLWKYVIPVRSFLIKMIIGSLPRNIFAFIEKLYKKY